MKNEQDTQENLGDNASHASIGHFGKSPCDSCHKISDILYRLDSRLLCSECYDSESKKSCCKSLIGFKDLTPEQIKTASVIHSLARSMEYINNSGYAHPRIAMIEELTKEPTSIEYMIEKMQMLFGVRIMVEA